MVERAFAGLGGVLAALLILIVGFDMLYCGCIIFPEPLGEMLADSAALVTIASARTKR